jgi:SfnB family sulfur acquisition oxidoreductase
VAVLSDNPTRAVPALSDPSDAVAVAAALAAEFRAGAVARDAARTVPREQLERIGHSGLLGITVPAAYGGADVTRATVAEVFRLLATADPSIAQIPQAHFGLIETLKLHGSDVQKQRFFSAILNGERFANAISERGTAAVNVRMTRLERTASGGVLDGRKYYSTGALTADWIAVTAQDEDNAPVFVLVPAGAEGLTRIDDWTGFGQRTSTSGTTILDGVRVDAEQILSRPGPDAPPDTTAAAIQLAHAAIDVGIARGAFEDGVAFVREQTRPWFEAGVQRAAQEPHVILQVGRLATRLSAAEALLRWAAETLDQVHAAPITPDSAAEAVLAVDQAKAFAAEISLQISTEILELADSSVTDAGHGLDRHWRNARTHTLHDPARWKLHHVGNFLLNDELPPLRLG